MSIRAFNSHVRASRETVHRGRVRFVGVLYVDQFKCHAIVLHGSAQRGDVNAGRGAGALQGR